MRGSSINKATNLSTFGASRAHGTQHAFGHHSQTLERAGKTTKHGGVDMALKEEVLIDQRFYMHLIG